MKITIENGITTIETAEEAKEPTEDVTAENARLWDENLRLSRELSAAKKTIEELQERKDVLATRLKTADNVNWEQYAQLNKDYDALAAEVTEFRQRAFIEGASWATTTSVLGGPDTADIEAEAARRYGNIELVGIIGEVTDDGE